MSTNQKILVGVLALLVWIGCIVAAHACPDMTASLGELKVAAQSVLAGLGVWHMRATPGE